MDKQIDARFERVEKALTALVDSITKYNPSVGAANDLSNAEHQLSQGLQEVQTHQTNHLRLLQLRAATAILDTQIRDTLVSLATTRKELISTPATKFPDDKESYPFTYPELLGFARRISKTSLPFMGASLEGMGLDREGNPLPSPDDPSISQPQSQAQVQSQTQAQDRTTGSSAHPSGTTNGIPPSTSSTSQPKPETAPTPSSTPLHPVASKSSLPALPDYLHLKANPRLNSLFYPFPSQPLILSGSLVANQLLSESGIDPKNHDPAAEAERLALEQAQRAEQAEQERLAREEESKRIRLEREEQMKRRALELKAEKDKLEREHEEEERRRKSVQAVGGGTAPGGSIPAGPIGAAGATAAPGSAISPTSEKIGAKGEFKFMADLDEDE